MTGCAPVPEGQSALYLLPAHSEKYEICETYHYCVGDMQMGCSRLRGTCNMGSDTISVFHNCDMQDIADKHPPQLPAMFVALAPLLPRSPVPLVTLLGLQSWSSW